MACQCCRRYYLNGVDAFRLKLLLPMTQKRQDELAAQQLEELRVSDTDADASHNIHHSNEPADVASQDASKEQQQLASLSGAGSQSDTANASESHSKDQQDCRVQFKPRTQVTDHL